MKAEAVKAFVLHTRPYSDNSLLVDLFTFEQGKLTVIAKGVKNKKPQRRQLLQPFRMISVGFQGRSTLKTLTDAEALSADANLQKEYLYSGLYLNELLLYFLAEQEPLYDLFEHYAVTINNLAAAVSLEPELRQFELALLSATGFAIDFACESKTGEVIQQHQYYEFTPSIGFHRLNNEPMLGQVFFQGRDLLAIADCNFTVDSLKAAKIVNRTAINYLLQGRVLKSREFFKQMMA